MPKTFENVRQTNRFGCVVDFGQRGDAGEFVVGFVDQHRRVARLAQNALDAFERYRGAGGIVRIRDQDRARLWGDGMQHVVQGEIHALARYGIFDDLRARHFGIEAIHRIGRLEHDHFVAVIDVRVDEHLNRFVGAVGEQELIGRHAENTARWPPWLRRIRDRRQGLRRRYPRFSASITRGEQPTVFSLKSRRSLPARPPVGGEYGAIFWTASRGLRGFT